MFGYLGLFGAGEDQIIYVESSPLDFLPNTSDIIEFTINETPPLEFEVSE